MDASIIVCTYSRAESLRDTLRALRALEAPASLLWEVIVVDNNSGDHTRAVVEDAQRDWPLLRYEFETQQGLSHARNHGIACARGEVLLFTDDDVLPEPDWLEATLEGLAKYQADACGGYIAPIWESPPPAWLTERFYGFLAVRTDRSDDYMIAKPSQAPFGANMAFRKSVFDRVGPFDARRGRKGKVLAGGEDIELFERVLAAGLRAVFLGQTRVHHKVEAYRCTKRYLRRWRYQSSRNLAITKGITGDRRLLNIPLYLFPQLARATVRTVTGHFTLPADEAFFREMLVCHFLGTMQGLFTARGKAGHG
ncbi:MAG: glycosyltransferase [Gammaproteobacteria bacterium]|jgi:glycosyltransferase involved in cell wall biosynthesis|nr:glycosyltransferase [Gammaproteobacteria bacterium]MBU1409135.1 glycosyltransferase [Gammaproteobacteria bacterium]MBU1531031.1 glycosyltransferase [Gammaproteobacteria bacterium]